jgi:hypothetical protein
LVFDPKTARLVVRHEWQTTGHTGVDEFALAELVAQEGAAREVLIKLLFDMIPANT